MARIAIVGVGAIGGVVAMHLERTGRHDILLCTRRPMEELIVDAPAGPFSAKMKNSTDPETAGTVDWVLVASKVYDAQSTAAWFQRLCGKDTPVVIIQNGVEHLENFSPFIDPASILPVIIDCLAERQDNGSIRLRDTVKMQVSDHPLGNGFSELFRGSDAEITLTDDFLTASWRKLCINAAAAVPALLAQPVGVLQDEALGQLVLDIIAECVAVGRAEGAHLDEAIGRQVLERYRSQPPGSIPSILADRMAGRPMEFDTRNGVIVRKGAKHGIPTPLNKMVVALLKSAT